MPSDASELPIISARRLSAPALPCSPRALADAEDQGTDKQRVPLRTEEGEHCPAATSEGEDTMVTAIRQALVDDVRRERYVSNAFAARFGLGIPHAALSEGGIA